MCMHKIDETLIKNLNLLIIDTRNWTSMVRGTRPASIIL